MILFVDDEPENVAWVAASIKDALDIEVRVVQTVEDAVATLHKETVELVITDIFVPLGDRAHGALGPRARRKAQDIEHLGGLVLLDELDRYPCKVLVHTACVDFALLEILGERQVERVPKPAPPEVLINAILRLLREREWTGS